MTDIPSSVARMEALSLHLTRVIEGCETYSPSLIEGLSPVEVLAVLQALPQPFIIRLLQPLFTHLLETDAQSYVKAVSCAFSGRAFMRLDNSMFFLDLLSGPGFAAVRDEGQPFVVGRLIKEWLQAQDPEPRRFVFEDKIPTEERAALDKHGLLKSTDAVGVLRLTAQNRGEFFRSLRDMPSERFPRASWMASDMIPDDGFPKAMSLLVGWFSEKGESSDPYPKERRNPQADRYAAFDLVNCLYRLFRERYERHGQLPDLERLHHIVWFVLGFLGDDADTGIFRPYSEIGSQNASLLVDYLLLNPKDHLSLFLMHNRDAQYSKLTKYGILFRGTEPGGSSVSSSGSERSLDEVSLAKHLLQPALAQLFDKHQQEGTLRTFWQMLKNDWLRPGTPASSLHPVVLRRACVPMMVKLAAVSRSQMRRAVFDALEFLVISSDGIPDTSTKVFSELRLEESLFTGRSALLVRRLVFRDVEASQIEIPTNGFAFECLLKLVRAGDIEAEALATRLLANPEFIRRDDFEFDIGANITRICGADSPLMATAVQMYVNSSAWQQCASEYTKQAVRAYLLAHGGTQSGAPEQDLESTEPDVRQNARIALSELASRDFLKFTQVISEYRKGRALLDVFADRGFLVDAIEKLLEGLAKDDGLVSGDERAMAAISLLDDLVADPDPAIGDDNDCRVRGGENRGLIVGTRTRACFAVARLVCLRPFLVDGWRLTQRLLHDRSAYVQYYAFGPFIDVLKRREWNENVRRESVKALWRLFETANLPVPIRKQLLLAFAYVRDITENDAARVLNAFATDKGVETLYIFYGIFRELHVQKMGPFDCDRFARLLEVAIDSETGDLPLRIFRGLCQVISEEPIHAARVLPYIMRYKLPQHAVIGIVDEGILTVERLLKHQEIIPMAEVLRMLIMIAQLEQEVLKNAEAGSRARWLHSLGGDSLRILYEKDKTGFYQYLDLLAGNLVLGKTEWSLEDVVAILVRETEAGKLAEAESFFDRLVASSPHYFPLRQEWVRQRSQVRQEGSQ